MALSQTLAQSLADAYGAGDIGQVNQIIGAQNVGANDVASYWNFTPEQMTQLGTTGVNFAQPNQATTVAQGTTQPVTNTYFQANPDVAASYAANSYGMTPDDFAQQHYQNYGMSEGRASPLGITAANSVATNTGVTNTGIASTLNTPNYDQLVRDQFASIGRTGIGTAANQIDQAGYNDWINALQTGAVKPENLSTAFQNSVADYLIQKPTDQYSQYVTNFLNTQKPAATQGITSMYQDVYGHAPTATELGNAFKQYGTDVTAEELGQFRTGAAADIGGHFAGSADAYFAQNPDVAAAYAKDNLGMTKDQFAQAHYNNHGSTEGRSDLATSGILSGFKYAHDQGISDDRLKNILGDTAYNQYKQGFNNYTKTATDNIMADNNLSFDEAANAVKFANDYGLSTQDLATMTGYNKTLFDNIKSGYDRGVTTIASKLDTDPEKATTQEIRTNIGGLLAAQNKYGITDAQLAAASNGKYTETGIAQLLDPVRNVQKNLTDLSTDATKSGAEVRSGINSLMSNKYVNALYGDALASTVAAANKSYSGEYGNKKFADLNPLSVNNVLSQLKAERDAAAQSGTKLINGGAAGSKNGGFGSEDAVLEDMAKNLVASGITDIRQVGQGPVTEKQDVVERYTYNGSPVREMENDYGGGKSYYTLIGDGESAEWKAIPKDQLTLSKGYIHSSWNPFDGETSGQFVPLTADELKTVKDGKATVPTGQTAIINKQTGQPLRTNYSERTGGNMWSGTFAGDGNTGYGVQFNKDGTPIFYTQGASSSDLGSIAPILAIAQFIPGVAPFAMAANAAIAASQGNWLGALASGLGSLPGLSAATGVGGMAADTAATLGNVSKGLGIANAANQKNWAGVLSGAANLGGMGNTQIGDTGINVGQAFKGLGVLGALDRKDYLSAGLGAASLGGVNTVPGTDVSLGNVMNAVNIGRAVQNFDKTGNTVPLINAVGQTVTRAKGGLLEGVTPDKVRASARNVDPAYFRGIASNLMRTA